MNEAEEACVTFVRAWAESALGQIDRLRQLKGRAARLNRHLDREWDPELEEALAPLWRQNWTEEHGLVWALHQLERWASRLARERGLEPDAPNRELRDLRNALEHLDDVVLDRGHLAEAGNDPKANRSLRRLPGGHLAIATGGKLFGQLDLNDLEGMARKHFERMEAEAFDREATLIEAAVDSYVDDLIAHRRELR